jgi:hypothetical protein
MTSAHEITYGDKLIKYKVLKTNRKTMEISVYPDTQVLVVAPQSANDILIHSLVSKRLRWIHSQINYFNRFTSINRHRKFVSGESHYYLGRQYRLRIIEGPSNLVIMDRKMIKVSSKNINTEYIRKIMDIWYRTRGRIVFVDILNENFIRFKKLGYQKPNIFIRKMEKRWGSLSLTNNLTLNPRLIQAPRSSIEYVILHELCHLKFRSHNRDFYNYLERILPDWKDRKYKLEISLS